MGCYFVVWDCVFCGVVVLREIGSPLCAFSGGLLGLGWFVLIAAVLWFSCLDYCSYWCGWVWFDCWLVASWLMLLLVSVLLVVCCVIYLELLLLGIGGDCLCFGWLVFDCLLGL